MKDPKTLGSPATVLPLQGRRVLVVDDEEDIRTFLLAVLADAGAQVVEAADGAEALAMARRHHPDLITLDLAMPGTDGVAAFSALREAPETEEIPVCIVTGHPEFRTVIYDRPCRPPEGYMNKPVDPDELVRCVRRILGLQRRKKARHGEG